jgi:hypothetical protein
VLVFFCAQINQCDCYWFALIDTQRVQKRVQSFEPESLLNRRLFYGHDFKRVQDSAASFAGYFDRVAKHIPVGESNRLALVAAIEHLLIINELTCFGLDSAKRVQDSVCSIAMAPRVTAIIFCKRVQDF